MLSMPSMGQMRVTVVPAPTHHEPQVPRVPGQLVMVVRVAEMPDGIVQHDVQQRIKPLACSATLPAFGELEVYLNVRGVHEGGESCQHLARPPVQPALHQ